MCTSFRDCLLLLRGLATLCLVLVCAIQVAMPDTFVASSKVLGRTPEVLGYNSGHFLPDSNTADRWRYSGVNGARIFSSPEMIEPCDADDLEPFGDGVTSAQEFVKRREMLRRNPLDRNYINWPLFEEHFANGTTKGNFINLDYALGELTDLGIEVVLVIGPSARCFQDGNNHRVMTWPERWEYWQHCYAHAFHVARRFGVHKFQLYNEPNHHSQSISQEQYLECLQFGSDAVQAAIADVNRIYHRGLSVQVQAPVTAGSINCFGPNLGGDPRDDHVGWGQLVLQNRLAASLSFGTPEFPLFHTYAYQEYGKPGRTFGQNLAAVKEAVAGKSENVQLRFALTELNVYTAADFSSLGETPDAPHIAARLGSILANLTMEQPDELYLFKFSQTANFRGGTVKKNGVHYVDNLAAPHNVGGATRSAEVVRLFAHGFAGGQDLLAPPLAIENALESVDWAASKRKDTGRYWLMVSNTGQSTHDIILDVSEWHLPEGSLVTVSEVSHTSCGSVSRVVQLPKDNRVSLHLSPTSVIFASFTTSPVASLSERLASDDAMVKSGVNIRVNYGESPHLWVKNSLSNPSARNVSLIKFEFTKPHLQEVDTAILRLTARNPGKGIAITHVYGISDDSWQEGVITWNNALNLAPCLHGATRISDNCVRGIGSTARFVGQIAVGANRKEVLLDVTDFIRDQSDLTASFLIAREVRYDGDNVDDSRSSVVISSSESGLSLGPQLRIYYADSIRSD